LIGAQAAQRPVGAFELLGVGAALAGDQRLLSRPRTGLAQRNAVLPGAIRQSAMSNLRASATIIVFLVRPRLSAVIWSGPLGADGGGLNN
jgi:hypothetical protein